MPTKLPETVPPPTAVLDELWRIVYDETKKDRIPGDHLRDSCVAFGHILKRMEMPHEAIRPVVDDLMKICAILRGDPRCFLACINLTSAIEVLHARLYARAPAPAGS